VLAIGFEAGFNNKASFNQAFKKYTRQTPSAFRKEPVT
jgi:AraC-like DNA-binding protein